MSYRGSINMDTIDPNKLMLPTISTGETKASNLPERKVEPQKQRQKFLKGPVPLPWLMTASKLPGKALAVGIALRFRQGLTGAPTIALPSTLLSRFGVDRHAKRRALDALEQNGLIAVDRQPGKNPVVTILKGPDEE
jgi:hypothetical protein